MITIQPLRDLRPCLPFALAINADPCLGDPMLRSQEQLQINLLSAQDKASHQAFGAYEGERLAARRTLCTIQKTPRCATVCARQGRTLTRNSKK